jgi:hypothetical protein
MCPGLQNRRSLARSSTAESVAFLLSLKRKPELRSTLRQGKDIEVGVVECQQAGSLVVKQKNVFVIFNDICHAEGTFLVHQIIT